MFRLEQLLPQLPQLLLSLCRSTHTPLQLVGHTVHCPLTQSCPDGHTLPQPPQLFESVFVLVSQPLEGSPSQLANPDWQVT